MTDFKVNPIVVGNLYRTESYSDDTTGTIHRAIPVTVTGERDPMRMEYFGASSILNINGRAIPVQFNIVGATSLADAIDKFPAALVEHVKAMQEAALRNKILGKDQPHIDLSQLRGNTKQ